jgi:hypothetical protein
MRLQRFPSALAAVAALAAAGVAQAQPEQIALDQVANVGGVQVACTGIGQTKEDPQWQAYPVRVEFARADGDYLASEVLTVSGRGGPSLSVACEGPWVLLQLPAGSYRLEGQSTEPGVAPIVQTVSSPGHGQARVVMTFPAAH